MSTIAKLLRIINNESQQEIADFLGCSRDTLSRKENGKYLFSITEYKKLSERYNVPLSTICDDESSREKIIEALQK